MCCNAALRHDHVARAVRESDREAGRGLGPAWRRAAKRLLSSPVQQPRAPGEAVSIDEWPHQVWPAVVVATDSVYQVVATIRLILGDDPCRSLKRLTTRMFQHGRSVLQKYTIPAAKHGCFVAS